MKTMKIVAASAAVAASVLLSGCERDLPSPEKINTVAVVVGRTAGYACDLAKMDKAVKESVAAVLDVVSNAIPTNGQTFAEAWMPIAEAEIKKLVDAGKLNEVGATAAKIAVNAAADGIDYVFIKYPKAKDVKDLVASAVEGFVKGFKGTLAFNASDVVEIDEDAYNYIRIRLEAAEKMK